MTGSLRLAAVGFAVLLSACESEVAGFLSCGQEVCGPRQECLTVDDQPSCLCLAGYVGEECEVCAFGYRRTLEGDCELIPIDCDDDPSVCGDHGQCTSAADGDFCSCGELYEGRLCERCTTGYQDNDLDGTCEATCSRAELDCEEPTRCSDASGTPECVCPAGYVGEQCEQCALGYREVEGDCVPTCETSDLACGARQVCDDSEGEPRCVCEPGYSGPTCDGCASGYAQDPATGACFPGCELSALECGAHGECSTAAGFAACHCDFSHAGELCDRCAEAYAPADDDTCRFEPPVTHTLLADAVVWGQSTLVAIDPATGDAVAVGEQALPALATGATIGSVYSFDGQSVTSLDLPSGERSPAVPVLSAQLALAYDAARARLYAIHASGEHSLLWADAQDGVVTPRGDTALGGVLDLDYDVMNDRLLVLSDGLFAVDPSSAEVTPLPDPPAATRGLAFGADGTLYALAATDLDAEQARLDACRRTAAALGLQGYATAPGTVSEPAADDATVALDSAQAGEPEVVAYLGRGVSAGQRTVTIASDNELAVLCLELRETTTLIVPETARLRALIAYAARGDATVDVEIDEAFTATSDPALHLGGVGPFTVDDLGGWARLYDSEEWRALALPIDPRFYAPGPGVLHVLDATFTSTSTTTLPAHVRPSGTLAAWSP